MQGRRRLEGVAFLGALLGFAWAAACGPASDSPNAARSLLDATAPSDDGGQGDPTAPVPEGSTPGCPTCTDAMAGARDAGAQDAEAGPASDAGICHVAWPQPKYDYYLDGADMQMADFYLQVSPIQMAVDPAGDAYLAVSYSTQDYNPAITLDLGTVPSPSYQLGVAIAKVDALCNLLWVREIGGPLTQNVANAAIALDASSNLTVLGAFQGTIDFGGATLSTTNRALYLARFDAGGSVVFAKAVPSDGSTDVDVGSLVVSPGGVSTVMAGTWLAADASDAGSGATDGAATQWVEYFLQFDMAGSVIFQSPPSATGPFVNQMAADSSGKLWGLGVAALDAGIPSSGPSIVMQLTSTGGVAWSEPTLPDSNESPLFAASAGGAVVFGASFGASSPYSKAAIATETLQSYLPDETSPWTQATQVSYASLAFDQQMVVDANGNPIVGGDFSGSVETSADGSTGTVATPSGIGFQAFDSTGHFGSVHTWSADGSDQEHFGALAVDPQGNVLLAGTTQRTGQFTTGTTSVFLVKLAR
jgi:hypothetical protein